jgi:hypothetical protein
VSGHQDRARHDETASRTLITAYPAEILPSGAPGHSCAAQSCGKTRHCRTYRRIRWSAPVIRSLEAAEDVLSGASAQSAHARCGPGPSHGLNQVRPDRLTAIHYPCQTRSGHVQGRNALHGTTGSGLVPPGLAGQDWRSRSRSIGRTPCTAHHDVES